MADPVKKPLTWSKAYPVYAEKHEMYRVFQELLKELIIWKPDDPLAYIKDEIQNIAKHLHTPRVFLVGPNVVAQGIGRNIAGKCGAKYITLADIVETSPLPIRGILAEYVREEEGFDEGLRKLLVATIMRRLAKHDCQKNGYILFGFPQNRLQAICAQQSGLLPRQVFILLPNPSFVYTKPTTDGITTTITSSKKNSSSQSLSDYLKSETLFSKLSSHVTLPEMDTTRMKEISEVFDFEICKMISYERWHTTRKDDIESEFLANMVSVKPCGSPWIPKILIIGPPSSGKRTVAQELSEKFSLININFKELVRGAATLKDEYGKACQKHLRDLLPLKDEAVKALLERRMSKDDCQRQGWILYGFPDVVEQLKVLEDMQLVPNRVFFLSCPEDECFNRLQQQRSDVLKRRLPGSEDKGLPWIDEMNYEEFPYGKSTFRVRFEFFTSSLSDISGYFGKHMIYVDASQRHHAVIQFIEACILRPPVIRYPVPHHMHTTSGLHFAH